MRRLARKGRRALAELSRLVARPDAAAWAHLASGFEDLGMSYDEAYARYRWAEALLAGARWVHDLDVTDHTEPLQARTS